MGQHNDILNKQLANWIVLNMKLHHYHWYVKGADFFALHEKFEELYDEAAGHIDDIAERLLAVGGKPISSLQESLATSSLKEAAGGESAEEMVAAVAHDFALMMDELKQGIAVFSEQGDVSSEDLLIGIYSSIEKHKWMLDAYLGK